LAGDWIKMRGNLWDDPRVSSVCDRTGQSEATVIGALYWLWATADQHTEDGILPGLTLRSIDRKTGVTGFAEALCEIGWLTDSPEGVRIARFEEHNGSSAKRRVMEAQRKANSRNVSASDADNERTEPGQIPPNCGAREEKSREEKKEKEAPAALTLSDLEAEGVSREAAAEWIAVRKRKKGGPVTPLAWAGFKSQALKAGWPLEAAVRKCVERSWVSFEAAWVAEGKPGANGAPAGHTVPSRAADETARYLAGRAEQEKQSTLPPPALLAKVRGAIKEAV
jgi:hypothetical protein